MSGRFLELILLAACPELRETWDAHRGTFGTNGVPDDQVLLDAVRRHVLGLLQEGRVAEFSRFTRGIERLLSDADPVLYDLLREGLLRPLVRDVREAGIARAMIEPHLGERLGLAWPEAP